jgi:hypothetical protein
MTASRLAFLWHSSTHHRRQLREEAVMAAITFNAARQKLHIQGQLKTVLAAFRERLDAFVSNRMRRAVAEAGHIRPRRPQGTQSQSISGQ